MTRNTTIDETMDQTAQNAIPVVNGATETNVAENGKSENETVKKLEDQYGACVEDVYRCAISFYRGKKTEIF